MLTIASKPLELMNAAHSFRNMLTDMMEYVVRQKMRENCHEIDLHRNLAVQFSFRLGTDNLHLDKRLTILCWMPNFAVWVGFSVEKQPKGTSNLEENEWNYRGMHSSCWRDSLRQIVMEHEHEMRMFDWIKPWEVVHLPDLLCDYFKYLCRHHRMPIKSQPPLLSFEAFAEQKKTDA